MERNFKTGGDNIGLIGLNKLHSEIFRFSHLSTYSTHSTQSILPTVKGDLACIALRTLNSTMLSQVMLRPYGMDVTSIPGFWTNYPATSYKWLSKLQVVEPVHCGQIRLTRQWAGTLEGYNWQYIANHVIIKYPIGKISRMKPTKESDSRKVIKIGHLWNYISTNLVGYLLKDGTVSNNVKSQRYYSMHCIAHILTW